ncbi:hypothetical protein NS183_07935 [Microbacterium testaceum]|nr:hypothetical protein NS183_07935 [Microbacterium testaceum]
MNWDGAITASTGYGKVNLAGKVMDTHRASWILSHGDIAPGMQICHTCDNRRCINPRHLFLGTRSDNMIDAALKGRIDMTAVRSAAAPKLSDAQVREIFSRVNAGEDRTTIANEYGVSPTTISKIRHLRKPRYEQIVGDLSLEAAS